MDTSRPADRPEIDTTRWFALLGEVRRRLGPGATLSPTARRFFQGQLAVEPDGVMVHRGPFAGYLAAGLRAEAATVGGHVFGGEDRLSEETPGGAALLGHELVHATSSASPTSPTPSAAPTIQRAAEDDPQEADEAEERRAAAMETLVTEIVTEIESEPIEEPATRVRPIDVTAVAERVYARIVDRLRDERARGAW